MNMTLKLQNIMPDTVNKRASVNLFDPSPTGGDLLSVMFDLHLTGSETLDQLNAMAKAKAKQLLQDAIGAL
jgi:hypothetical protein